MTSMTTQQTAPVSVFSDIGAFENAQRMAAVLAASALVPKHFQGGENIANCVIALEMANRIGASPMAVCQSLYVVHGTPSWSAKFLIATWNTCGRYEPIRYEISGQGKDYGCIAYSAPKGKPDERIEGPRVSIAMAEKEGWLKNPKWHEDGLRDLMLRYRAAAFLIRTTAPELSLGLLTQEEIQDTGPIDMGKAERVSDVGAADLTAMVLGDLDGLGVDTDPTRDATPLDGGNAEWLEDFGKEESA